MERSKLKWRLMVLCFVATLLITASAMAARTGTWLKECTDRAEPALAAMDKGERASIAEVGEAAVFAAIFFGYVEGVVDEGWSPAPCITEGVTKKQIFEVVRKYLKDHPEELGLPAATIIQKAINKAWPCK